MFFNAPKQNWQKICLAKGKKYFAYFFAHCLPELSSRTTFCFPWDFGIEKQSLYSRINAYSDYRKKTF